MKFSCKTIVLGLCLATIFSYKLFAAEKNDFIISNKLYIDSSYAYELKYGRGYNHILRKISLTNNKEYESQIYNSKRYKNDQVASFFASSWILNKNKLTLLFPNGFRDATGRMINLYIHSDLTKNPNVSRNTTNINGDIIGVPYLSSVSFLKFQSLLTSKDKADIIFWSRLLCIRDKVFIISRIKIYGKNKSWGSPHGINEKNYYKWELREGENGIFKKIASIEITDDFLPFEVMWVPQGFRIFTDDGSIFERKKKLSFYIWGKSRTTGNLRLALMTYNLRGKIFSAKMTNVKSLPKKIVYNNDSKYLMLLYKSYSQTHDNDSLCNIMKLLKKRNLLKKYKIQLKHDSAQSSLNSKINISKPLQDSNIKKTPRVPNGEKNICLTRNGCALKEHQGLLKSFLLKVG